MSLAFFIQEKKSLHTIKMATIQIDKKSFIPFSKIVMDYIGTSNMVEVNRYVLSYYKTCKDRVDEKNASMFMNYIINSEAYILNSRRTFNHTIDELKLVVSDARIDQLYGEYVRPKAGVKIHPITKDSIINFLKNTSEFESNTRDTIYNLAQSHYQELSFNKDLIPKSVIDSVIDKCETSPDAIWSIVTEMGGDVHAWIDADADIVLSTMNVNEDTKGHDFSHLDQHHEQSSSSHIINSIHKRYKERSGENAPDELIRRTLDCMANVGRLVDVLCESNHPATDLLADTSRRLIAVFETIYGRPITVHEFLKWSPRLKDSQTNVMSSTLRESLEHFNESMNMVDKIHKQYLGKVDDRYVMIGKYINEIDHSTCYENLINSIIENRYNAGVYEKCMRELIVSIYKNTYDKDPRPTDVDYFFKHAKLNKYHLESTELSGLITEKKQETDLFIASMVKVFQNILCRDPDVLEVVEYLEYYRNDMAEKSDVLDSISSDTRVANELYASLEFNDVLRNEIQRLYIEITKTPPLPSVMYKCLQHMLKSDETKRNYKECIAQYIRK